MGEQATAKPKQATDVKVIHIDWDGPFTLSQLRDGKGDKDSIDRGVYQIYGTHLVYGPCVLLYIGKTEKQTFKGRISQEGWDNDPDTNRVEIYLGRLFKPESHATPDEQTWLKQIGWAERLLIRQHVPAHNCQGVTTTSEKHERDLQDVHVLNWGKRRSLAPEVTGAYWTWKYFDEAYNWYGTPTPSRDVGK